MAAANPEEVRAMKERLRARQAERRQEVEDAEVFSLIRRREAGDREIPTPVRGPEQAEVCLPRKEETVPLYGKVTTGVVVEAVVNGVIRNWLFEMVLGLAVFAAAVL